LTSSKELSPSISQLENIVTQIRVNGVAHNMQDPVFPAILGTCV